MKTLVLFLALAVVPAFVSAAEPRVLAEDPFQAKPAVPWSWLRENPAAWRLHGGGLEICVEPGVAGTVKNALLRPAPARKTPYAVEVSVTFTAEPTNQFEQAGITWYRGGQPVFKLVHEHIDGKEYIIPGRAPAPERTVDLRLIVSADKFTAQFRTEGQAEYRDAAAGPLPPGSDEQISLQCYNGPAGAQHWIRFTKFRLVEVAEADLSKQK